MTITATEFKAKCLGLMDEVKKTNQPILITKRGEVVAQLVPPSPAEKKPWLRLRGMGRIRGDLVSPVVAERKLDAVTGGELEHGTRRKDARRSAH